MVLRRERLALVAFLAATPALSILSQQAPPRDVPAPPPNGTAVVAGVVLADEPQPSPVRRARVTLRPDGWVNGWSVTTGDDGRFAIVNVPAGRYTLSASKTAWITANYGAARPGRPGTPFAVAEGERIPSLAIRMSRGAVITGTVIDRMGAPVPGASVSAMRYSPSELTGQRVLRRPEGGVDSVTDDVGGFRSYGLPPGEYVVVATLRIGPPTGLMDLRPLTEADVQRALAGGAAPAVQPPLVGYAPVYFPGTVDPSQAVTVRVGSGQERAGVTIRLEPTPTARIDAVPTLPDSASPASLQVFLVPAQESPLSAMGTGRREADGRFVFSGVTPGSYTLLARAAAAGAAPPAAVMPPGRGRGAAAPMTHYASVDLMVDGRDLTVPLDIQPGMTVSGSVRYVGDQTRVPQERPLSFALLPTRDSGTLGVGAAQVDASGAFRFVGVPPGKYRFAQATGAIDPWTVASALSRGRDLLDELLEVRAGEDVTDLQVTFSDRSSELGGRLETAEGRAALDHYIIAFAADRAFWTPLSRRVRQTRPGTEGRFTIRGLPAGDYFIAALTDIEPGEWYDPTFLAALVPAAAKVTIRDGERTAQDLRITK